jgi:putative ABC transport system permease protein
MVELFQLAVGNLLRARTRLAMTSGGVVVGTTAVILLIAITFGLQQAAEAGIGSSTSLTEMQIYPGWRPDIAYENLPKLDIPLVQTLYDIPGVALVIPSIGLDGGGELNAGKLIGYAGVQAIDPSLVPYLGLTADLGEISLEPGEVIVGSQVAANFFDPNSESYEPVTVDLYNTPIKMKIYQWSGDNPQTKTVTLKIAAVLASNATFDYSIIMPIQDALTYNAFTNDTPFDPKTFQFNQITVRAVDRDSTQNVAAAIRELGYEVSGMADFLNQLNQFFMTMRLMLGGVGGVALLVAAFGVANTMTMAILERTREIGLMKAIGATDREVLSIFLIEAGLVGLVGGTVGVGLSYFLQNVVNSALANAPADSGGGGGFIYLPIDPSQLQGQLLVIPPELAIGAMLLATAVGIAAGLLPALRAARMQPVLALKTE